jgi:hypothetical protein
MGPAVSNFATYLAGEDSWALGRFVVPVTRLDELAAAATPFLSSPAPGEAWHLAALSSSDLEADLAAIENFNGRYAAAGPRSVIIDSLERKTGSPADVKETMHRVPVHLQAYLEVPTDRDPAPLLASMAGSRLRAKVRTGGVTADAFPSSAALLRFIAASVRAKVPFKATAGLHHPLRADYRLTYAPNSSRSPMFGFLNVFLTAAALHSGMGEAEALELLEEGSLAAFRFSEDGVRWRSFRLGLPQLQQARREAVIAFGSCSFTEPIGELQASDLLEPSVSQP